jgi:hypothetical protein
VEDDERSKGKEEEGANDGAGDCSCIHRIGEARRAVERLKDE